METHGNESSLDVSRDERLVRCESFQEFDIGVRSDDLVLAERLPQDPQRLRPRRSVDDEFCDQRVVEYLDRRVSDTRRDKWNERTLISSPAENPVSILTFEDVAGI